MSLEPTTQLPSQLPPGVLIQSLLFIRASEVTIPSAMPGKLLELREPSHCVVLSEQADIDGKQGTVYPLLCVPHNTIDTPEYLPAIIDWVEPGVAPEQRIGQTVMLQGVQIVWGPERGALIAPLERWETARRALIEFTYVEAELRRIEQAVAASWPELQADAPLAFEVAEHDMAKQEGLKQRFVQVFQWRAALARLEPLLHRPVVHPPTLASQIGERLRERTRMIERCEFLGGQLEVFERMHDLCSQRISDFASSRKHLILEWIIIILLLVETVVLLVDYLTPVTPEPTVSAAVISFQTDNSSNSHRLAFSHLSF